MIETAAWFLCGILGMSVIYLIDGIPAEDYINVWMVLLGPIILLASLVLAVKKAANG